MKDLTHDFTIDETKALKKLLEDFLENRQAGDEIYNIQIVNGDVSINITNRLIMFCDANDNKFKVEYQARDYYGNYEMFDTYEEAVISQKRYDNKQYLID